MTEREFQTCLQDGAAFVGIHPTPIPDSGGIGQRFTAPKVYDLVLTCDGVGHHCELKKVSGKKFTWPFKDLKQHQEENLKGAAHAGAMAWVIVLWQVVLGKKARKSERWAEHETHEGAYGFQLWQLLEERDENFKTGLTLDWMVDHGVYLPELVDHDITTPAGNPKRLWDPRPLTRKEHRL